MSVLANLRAAQNVAVGKGGKMVLNADQLVEKVVNDRNYTFFQIGAQVLTLKAIEKAVAKGAIQVDWEPKKLDAKGKPVNPVQILDEVHIEIQPGYEMFPTDSGFIGFGAPGVLVSASDLINA